jgi:hypothetical protein
MILTEVIVVLITSLIAISIVGKAWAEGMFGGSLGRAFAGGTVGVVSNKFLVQYTQFESLITASAAGSLGFIGYFFILGLSVLILVWISNLIEYRSLVV